MYVFKQDYHDTLSNRVFKTGDICDVNGISIEKDGGWIFDVGSVNAIKYGYIKGEEYTLHVNFSHEELELLKAAIYTYKEQCNSNNDIDNINLLNVLINKMQL